MVIFDCGLVVEFEISDDGLGILVVFYCRIFELF